MSVYPNGFITIRKLEKMVDNPTEWRVFAKSKITHDVFDIKDRNDLREYAFYEDYTIGYEFLDDWAEYTSKKNKDEVLFDWKKFDIEISVERKDDKLIAEIVKWENNKPSSEDLPSRFVLAYWNERDLKFIGNYFIKYIPFWLLPSVYINIKKVQNILNNFSCGGLNE